MLTHVYVPLRAPSSLRPIFGSSAEADRDALYSETQVHQALQRYQEQQQLSATGSCIKLDRWAAQRLQIRRPQKYMMHAFAQPTLKSRGHHAQAKLLCAVSRSASECMLLHDCNQHTAHEADPCRLLIGGLFNKKEDMKEGDVHPFDDTLRRLLSKLQVYHTISRPTPTVSLQAPLADTVHYEFNTRRTPYRTVS